MNREIGAAITVQANAMRVLEYFGYEQENLRGVDFFGVWISHLLPVFQPKLSCTRL
jgi:hypothetical protein